MDEKKLWEEGAAAYRDGQLPEDNPYSGSYRSYADVDYFKAWKQGYEKERDFWESNSTTAG